MSIFDHVNQLVRELTQSQILAEQSRDAYDLGRVLAEAQSLAKPFHEAFALRRALAEVLSLTNPLQEAYDLSREVAQSQSLAKPFREVCDLGRESAEVWSLTKQFRDIQGFTEAYVGRLREGMPEFRALAREILALRDSARELFHPLTTDLSNHFLEQAARASWLGERDNFGANAGILATLSPSTLAGTFTWGTAKSRTLHPALWSDNPPQSRDTSSHQSVVELQCEAQCVICGAPLFVSTAKLFLSSKGEVQAKISVFPLCVQCTHAAAGSPEYWDEAIEGLLGRGLRPRFSLIEGGGQTADPPKGRALLSLVEDENPEDS